MLGLALQTGCLIFPDVSHQAIKCQTVPIRQGQNILLTEEHRTLPDSTCLLQIAPPGFNFIWLPYKDDIRHPDTDPSFLGPSMHKDVSDEQLSAASEMLSKLDIPEFVVGSIPNPHLQRHYRVRMSDWLFCNKAGHEAACWKSNQKSCCNRHKGFENKTC